MSAPKRLIAIPGVIEDANGLLGRDESQAIVERVVKMSTADAVRVNVGSGRATNLRFAANQMSTAGAVTNANVAVFSAFGPKHAVVTTNDLSEESLRRAVKQSEALARLAPDDPESMPELPSQSYTEVPAYFDTTANVSAEERARAALTALEPARRAGDLKAAGFIVANAGTTALGNDEGLFAYHRNTNANYTVTVRSDDGTGSGWAGADDSDWSKINFGAVSARAIEKARLSRNPVKVEPGRYTVILEPQAVGDLVQLLAFAAAARLADEGRSAFSKTGGGTKIGEQVVDKRVTIFSDPFDAQLLGQPWDGDGLPLTRQVWVEKGVLKNLVYSRFWAKKMSKQPTGGPNSLKMLGGTTSMEEMIRSTPRGILVTRLWYLRQVDPRTVLYTGLTRDGTFLVENGKISKAITNLRFNDSPLFMLNNVEAIGPAVRLAGTEAGGNVVMPALKVKDFNFTSLSEAV